MSKIEKALEDSENIIIMMEEMISHNIEVGNISKETTASELLVFLKDVRYNFIPLQKEVSKLVANNKEIQKEMF